MCPIGCVHVTLPAVKEVIKLLEIDYAEAVVILVSGHPVHLFLSSIFS
jgi:Rad4 beta-hairpin domain 3